jgi:ribosomal protein L7/L12
VDDARIVGFLQKGKMIEAIQVYRELYPGMSLGDAKRAVEDMKLRYGL